MGCLDLTGISTTSGNIKTYYFVERITNYTMRKNIIGRFLYTIEFFDHCK